MKPYRAASKDTLSRWCKSIIKESRISIHSYTSHSSKAAASSYAKSRGALFSTIIQSTGWKSKRTFPQFVKNKSKKLSFKIVCYRKIKLYKKFVKVYLYKKCFQSSYCERFRLLVNKPIFIMKLMTTTNHSENKTKLIVFSSSSGSAFRLTVKSSK